MSRTEEHLNKLLEEGNISHLKKVEKGTHYIRTLVTDYARTKEVTSLNYKTDLKSGIRLDPVHYFTADGLLNYTIYLHGDIPVLRVSEVYEYNAADAANTEMNQSKKAIHSRNKIWEYYFEDGTLDTSDTDNSRDGEDRETSKSKEKIYKSIIQGLTIGNKRRHNIQIILSERMSASLIIMGIFATSKEAEDAMRQLSAEYSAAFQEFQKYGTENIIDLIENDTKFDWLNVTLPTDSTLVYMRTAGHITEVQEGIIKAAIGIYELENIQGMTMRQYAVEKLKGNIR